MWSTVSWGDSGIWLGCSPDESLGRCFQLEGGLKADIYILSILGMLWYHPQKSWHVAEERPWIDVSWSIHQVSFWDKKSSFSFMSVRYLHSLRNAQLYLHICVHSAAAVIYSFAPGALEPPVDSFSSPGTDAMISGTEVLFAVSCESVLNHHWAQRTTDGDLSTTT